MCEAHQLDPSDIRPEREPSEAKRNAIAYVQQLEALREQTHQMALLAVALNERIDTDGLERAYDCITDMISAVRDEVELP